MYVAMSTHAIHYDATAPHSRLIASLTFCLTVLQSLLLPVAGMGHRRKRGNNQPKDGGVPLSHAAGDRLFQLARGGTRLGQRRSHPRSFPVKSRDSAVSIASMLMIDVSIPAMANPNMNNYAIVKWSHSPTLSVLRRLASVARIASATAA